MEKSNKTKTIMIVGIVILVIVAGILYFFTDFGRKTSYTEINLNQLTKKMENNDTFILYIGSSTCTACQSFNPTLKRVIKDYNVTIYYINVHKLNESENSDLLALINYNSSTPKVYFIENGEYSQYNMISGVRSYEDVVEKLEKNGYIK